MNKFADLSVEAMQNWLENHVAAIEAGANVGQLAINKAQQFRLELIRRGA